ncbi:hypothetical protein [Streptomyces sp. NPDC051921]|uniref:hypothetical protein n=1 Tax=Streptomyces sp. NPDC051921 TaxID=3155806 RepID=UPI003433A2DB
MLRRLPAPEGPAALVVGHAEEHTVAQIAASPTGALRVAVTTPRDGRESADV